MPTKKSKDSFTVAVGKRLAAARKAVVPAITQSEAAALLSKSLGKNITGPTISGYESGHRLPPVPLVSELCRIYGTLTAAYIFHIDNAAETMQESNLLTAFRLADARGKRAITSLARAESVDDRFGVKADEAAG
ncbi:helix-turn-helix domain-containing protein [Xylella fastidiosa]|uniref:helix-turn-helix domain-containing protein n=1 Tax=Xylella fastidiosa TaxID=2371 RepID=UPI00040A8CBD|nr:helix-turn-helix transcriptional regulator [Xylella fastidiosa]QPB73307.1 helix-turn-helix transcriptional regulator [Xylella fastidiosa]